MTKAVKKSPKADNDQLKLTEQNECSVFFVLKYGQITAHIT